MENRRFDALAARLATRLGRRAAVPGLLSAGLALVGNAPLGAKKKKARHRTKTARRVDKKSVRNCRKGSPLDWGPEWPPSCGQVRSRCCPKFAKPGFGAYCTCLRDLGCATCEHGPNSVTIVPLEVEDLIFSGSSDNVIGPLRLDAGQYRISARYVGDDDFSVIARWSDGSDDLPLFNGTGDVHSFVDILFDNPVTVVLEVTGVGAWELHIEKLM